MKLDTKKIDVQKVVDLDGVRFWVGPETLSETLTAQAKIIAIGDPSQNTVAAVTSAGTLYSLVERIKAWDGVEDEEGNPLPCTARTKDLLFGQRPDLFWRLLTKLREDAEEAGKNSASSQGGPEATTPASAETAAG